MGNRFNKDTCRSGRHAWIDENIAVKSGRKQCRPCLLEGQRKIARARRALARSLGEVELVRRLDLEVSYWPRIEKRNGCWIWRGCVDGAGYGYVSVLNRPVSAHRIGYRIAKGDIQKGLEVCHSCDTPLCVRPAHLFLATHGDNMRDMWSKGRHPGFANHAKTF